MKKHSGKLQKSLQLAHTGTMSNSEAKESVAGPLKRSKYLASGQGEGHLEDILEHAQTPFIPGFQV